MANERTKVLICSLLVLLGLLLFWQAIAKPSVGGKTQGLPGPVPVALTAWDMFSHPFYDNGPNDKGIGLQLLHSLARLGMGYTGASLVAICLGVVLGLSPTLYRAVNPYIQILKPISPLAWMPLFLYTIQDSGKAAILVIFMSSLWPTLANTAFENVRIGVRAAYPSWSRGQVREYVEKYLSIMGLNGAERKRPAALSGGMRQRVGLARAFAVQPKVLLLDEPFAQIDALTRGVIQEELLRMWMDSRNTVFMVTHGVDEAILLSDKIVLMTNGPEARIAEIVEIPIPRPRTRQTIIEHPLYYRIRNHLIHFLLERSQHLQRAKGLPQQAFPPLVRITEE